MKKQNRVGLGIIFALLTSVISGLSIFYSKLAVVKIDPLVLTTSRNLYVGLLFAIFFIFTKKYHELKKLRKDDVVKLVLIGVIGGSLPFYLFFQGLKYSTPQTANFIHKTLFIWVTIFGVISLKEKINFAYIIGFILVIASNLLLTPEGIIISKGEVMIFAATLLWAIENIIAKRVLDRFSSELVGIARMALGSILLLIAVIATGRSETITSLNLDQIRTVLLGGSLLFLYVFNWYKALKYASASLVTLILTFSVVVGSILSNVYFGFVIPKQELLSYCVIAAAIIITLNKNLIAAGNTLIGRVKQ